MIALNILDIRNFMSKLLGGNSFDTFWFVEASITTYVTFTIDGNLHKEFFDSSLADSLHLEERDYTLWKEVKPFCFSIMRGKHTPLHFKIIFRLSPEPVSYTHLPLFYNLIGSAGRNRCKQSSTCYF